jgi:hypothetical protein
MCSERVAVHVPLIARHATVTNQMISHECRKGQIVITTNEKSV